MPWMEDPTAQRWQVAFTNALRMRITPDRLSSPLWELVRADPLSGEHLSATLLGLRAGKHGVDDPLLFQYARLLLGERYIGIGDLLSALLSGSSYGKSEQGLQELNVTGLPTCEERVFLLLLELSVSEAVPTAPERMHATTRALARWLHVVSEYENNKQLESAGLHTVDQHSLGMYDALARLALSVFGKPGFRSVAKQPWWSKRRATVAAELQNYDMHVLQWMHSQWSGQLQALTRLPPFLEMDADGRPILGHDQVVSAVMQAGNIPTAHSRAGLFIWLNASLCGRPMTDDLTMLGYLQTRYSGDNQTLTVQLLHAVFDVLTNAILSGERPHSVKVLRSFICNKMPLLLSILGTFMGQVIMETCVQTAFLSIAMDPIQPISAGSSEATELLKRTRLEFLQACALHGVVSEGTISAVSQEPPITLPKIVKYTKEGLLAQCANNIGRLEPLAGELQSMQGNAGAIAGCIVDLIGNLCASKDTMSLKSVCSIIIKRIPDVDVILQYSQPSTLLIPLCMLLKDWMHDQDQSEFTPEYEEFASILLFTLAVMHRYDLDVGGFGLLGNGGFVARVLGRSPSSSPLADLSAEQSQQLGKWLEGLFATDDQGEASGIGDEVMRQCPPQAFYVLVPALFEQSVMACRSGHLTVATFRSGLELLLEPFLLPSLIAGLGWLVSRSWEDHGDTDVLLQVLDKLLKPSGSSVETQAMHKAVLTIIAEPLKRSLEDLVRKRPHQTAANRMIALLGQLADSTRSTSANTSELVSWNAAGCLDNHLRKSTRELTAWAANGTPNPPPRYTPRLFSSTFELLGPDRTLMALATELRDASINSAPILLDVCTSMVCASSDMSQALRQELAMQVADTQSLLGRSLGEATALVRLHRSIETQLTIPTIQLPAQEAAEQMMQELGLTETAQVVGELPQVDDAGHAAQLLDADLNAALEQPMNVSTDLTQDLTDLSAGNMQVDQSEDFFKDLDIAIDQQHPPPQHMQHPPSMQFGAEVQQNQDDDIFAGLDMSGGMGDLGDDDFTF